MYMSLPEDCRSNSHSGLRLYALSPPFFHLSKKTKDPLITSTPTTPFCVSIMANNFATQFNPICDSMDPAQATKIINLFILALVLTMIAFFVEFMRWRRQRRAYQLLARQADMENSAALVQHFPTGKASSQSYASFLKE